MPSRELDDHLRFALGPPRALPTIEVRPLTGDDREALTGLFGRLSAASVYRRFHRPAISPEVASLHELLLLDGAANAAVAAAYGDDLVGVASYHQPAPGEPAEAAVVVDDPWQRHGIGRRLLRALAATAAGAGVVELNGIVQTGNEAMLGLVYDVFPEAEVSLRFGEHLYDVRVKAA